MNTCTLLALATLSFSLLPPEDASPYTPESVAIVAGTPLSWSDLAPHLAETAGATILEELALDNALRSRLARENMELTPSDIEAERLSLLAAIADEAATSPQGAGQLLDSIRSTRGLGPRRFNDLLRRNAALRKLIQPVEIPEQDLAAALELEFGPRYRIRIATYTTLAHAAEARARLHPDPPCSPAELPFHFAEEALEHSTDRFAPRGGLVPDASPVDPALPAGVRSALPDLTPGEVSEVIAVDGGYALVLLESRTEGRTPTDAQRARVESRLRRRFERLAMDALARDLVTQTKVIVTDESLKWAWDRRER
jgi:hypothetical protein